MILDVYRPKKFKRALFLYPCPRYPPDPRNFVFLGSVEASHIKRELKDVRPFNDTIRTLGYFDMDTRKDRKIAALILENVEP